MILAVACAAMNTHWNRVRTCVFLLRTGNRFGVAMLEFYRRLLLHYGIYRRYPLGPLPALKNAWRIART
jgi:hypothetical protein